MQKKFLLSLLFLVACLQACSLKDPASGGGGLIIHLEDQEIARNLDLSAQLKADSYFQILTNPTSTADFNCFAVNVTGAGIGPKLEDLNNCTSADNMHGKGFGILSEAKMRNQAINVMVPSGPERTISVYGIYPHSHIPECGGTATGTTENGEGFYLGETTLGLFGPASVTIPISYNGANSTVSCTGNGGGAGSSPSISFVQPDGGVSGTNVTIVGNNLSNVTSIDMMSGGTAVGTCTFASATNILVTCTSVAAGLTNGTVYGVRVNTSDSQAASLTNAYKFVSGGPHVAIPTDPAVTGFGTSSIGVGVDHTFTITNTGNSGATSLSGVFAPTSDFDHKGGAYPGTGGTCSSTLSPAASCTVVITFTPIAAGPVSATYTLGGSVRTITGTGI